MNQSLNDPFEYGVPPVRRWAWIGRIGLSNALAFGLTAVGVIAGVVTYLVLSRSSPLLADQDAVRALLTFDLVLAGALALVVGWRVLALIRARRSGAAGARLQLKLVLTFTLLAVAPAVVVAGLSGMFFFVSVQVWFGETVSGAVKESSAVAQAALEVSQRTIIGDSLAVANAVNREVGWVDASDGRIDALLTSEIRDRQLVDALIFDSSGKVLARSELGFSIGFDTVRDVDLQRAQAGDVVMMVDQNDNRVRALLRLDRYMDAFLLVSRIPDATLQRHLERSEEASAEYSMFETRRLEIQRNIMLIFAIVALVLLLASVLLGLSLANQLIRPIGNLINASERVRAGDLSVRVPQTDRANEMGKLIRSFNRMTNQLQTQRRELTETNLQLDERRRFTEAVLSGVSAGILDVDAEGIIQLANIRGAQFLGYEPDDLVGRSIYSVMPELTDLLNEAKNNWTEQIEKQLQFDRPGEPDHTLLVRIAPELMAGELSGFVVTFDEITALVSAQRQAAWADVARRIAHEIKNPLTPIQLSAERLKRRYLKQITDDPETFQDCTDTIVRQVDDIRRLVDEFSAFARMPAPVIREANVSALVREAVILQRHANPDIKFSINAPAEDVLADCDQRQMSRVLTNLLLNAVDAIIERGEGETGTISVTVAKESGVVEIAVQDNGKGLPKTERNRLTEPYVTTKAKGTGLGLAIVKKILEDHRGTLTLEDAPVSGALVRLAFPRHVATVQPTVSDLLSGKDLTEVM